MPARHTVWLLPSEGPNLAGTLQGTGMKSNLKWYAMRGVMLLASTAAAFAFVVDHARRW
jgi:hypothetical protein